MNVSATILNVLIEKMLMTCQYVFGQAILVSGTVFAKVARKFRFDAAFEIVMPLQMMLVFVTFPAGLAVEEVEEEEEVVVVVVVVEVVVVVVVVVVVEEEEEEEVDFQS
ncbi:hypothetical protein M0804_015299 [Polistes exclamans]|nr:hypothetical protein M0804_015302 [Polistes exclamans]KAI4473525.1 hypothetical protein M0804_015299 [Polistes exclamans]